MGITIHYRGTLKSASSLPAMIDEVKDIAAIHEWDYDIFKTQFPPGMFGKRSFNDGVYGICFTPPYVETIDLTFLSNGRLASRWEIDYYFRNKHKGAPIPQGAFSKTHYGGPEMHQLIIHLLDHVSKKYFKRFRLTDEAKYWETRDEKLLDENFKVLNDWMSRLGVSLETQPLVKGETISQYFERILKEIHASRNK